MDTAQQFSDLTTECDQLRSKLKSANAEAKSRRLSADSCRVEAEEWEAKLTATQHEGEALKKSHGEELDRLKIDHNSQLTAAHKERDEAKSSASARIIDADLKLAAREAGMVDLDALKLLDRSGVKVDDDGNVTNAVELLEAMKTAKPYLFKVGNTTSLARKPPADLKKDPFDARTASADEVDKQLYELTRPGQRGSHTNIR